MFAGTGRIPARGATLPGGQVGRSVCSILDARRVYRVSFVTQTDSMGRQGAATLVLRQWNGTRGTDAPFDEGRR